MDQRSATTLQRATSQAHFLHCIFESLTDKHTDTMLSSIHLRTQIMEAVVMCRLQVRRVRAPFYVIIRGPVQAPMANRCPSRYQSPDVPSWRVVAKSTSDVAPPASVLHNVQTVVTLQLINSLLLFRPRSRTRAACIRTLKLRVLPASHHAYRSITHTIHHRRP